MSSLRQQTGAWFIQNPDSVKASLKETELDKFYKKALKDLSATKDTLTFPTFKQYWKAYFRGAFDNLKSKVNASIKAEKKLDEIKLEVWRPNSTKLDPKAFDKWVTGTGVDIIFSNKGGIPKASTFVWAGGPGKGKTTVSAYVQYRLQENYPKAKIACVQAEMKRFDINYELHENDMPWMGDLNYLILKDYGFENLKNTLIKIFTSGHDVLFVDSFENIAKKLVVYENMSQKEAENFLLELFDNANDGKYKNEKGQQVFTTIIAIQQVTKGGEFKGDNALMHETTGMCFFDMDSQNRRYMSYRKNRRCGRHVEKKLYHDLDKKDQNKVVFDVDLFNETEARLELIHKEQAAMNEKTKNFMTLFSTTNPDGVAPTENVIDKALREEEEEVTA